MGETIIASIITGVCSLIVGFISGYNYCVKVNKINKQNARDNAIQIQSGDINVKEK